VERGFEQTTAAEIAERAGLTKRTFFRYFTDKRDVLSVDSDALLELVVKAVAEAPESAAPVAAVGIVAVFKIAFGCWVEEPDRSALPRLVQESLDVLNLNVLTAA
jgi:AcrR family transcriptional regulator